MTTLTTLFVLAVTFHSTGMNGDCCEEPIVIENSSTPYQTTDLTSSGYDLYSECDLMGIMHNDVWFEYVAPSGGQVTVTTCDPDSFDTSIIIYESPLGGCAALNYLACSGDAPVRPECQQYQSTTDFPVDSGHTYMIRVGGWQEDSFGSGTLTVSLDDHTKPVYCPADINRDRLIDGADLTAMLGDWGSIDSPADLTGDNLVDGADLAQLLGEWGLCPLQGSWQVLVNAPVAPYLHHDSIAVIGETLWICNVSGQIFKSIDAGDTWVQVADQPGTSFRTISFIDDQRGVVGNLGPGSWVGHTTDTAPLYITNDGGLTWVKVPESAITGDVPDGVCGIQWVDENTIHGAGRYAGKAYFITSTDGGSTWISRDLTDDYYAFVDVWFEDPLHGYITGTNNQGRASLVETHDGGLTWTTRKTNQSGHYWKMGFANESFGYGVCSGGADIDKWVQTHDGGDTWTEKSFTDDFHANGIGFLNEQVGWIGGYPSHTLQTSNGGQTWEPIQIDLVYGDVINKFLKVDESTMYAVGNRVYRYAEDHSGFRRAENDVTFRNERCKIRAVTRGSTTTISYTVPDDGHVMVNVFIRGSLLQDRPVDAFQKAGEHRIVLHTPADAPELFASIQTGDYRRWTRFELQPEEN